MILRRPDVLKLIGVGSAALYQWVAAGQFPKPVQLGPRAVGWRRSDVIDWIAARPSVGYGNGNG